MNEAPAVDVVVPTAARPCLGRLLEGLAAGEVLPRALFVALDARVDRSVSVALPRRLAGRTTVLRARRPGPAAARNAGWRASEAAWVAFLDDDVEVGPEWGSALLADLEGLAPEIGGSQARVVVPLPAGRRPTDWERNVARLEGARWATADMALRRIALARVGGFDERFARAYREDSDLGLRLRAAGFEIARGVRTVAHPVRPAGVWTSVGLQAGNADDVMMRMLHGRRWRAAAGAPRGRLRRHLATTVAALTALLGMVGGSRRLARGGVALWIAGTAELAAVRIAPGPRDRVEVSRMLATSALLPLAASAFWARGWLRAARLWARGADRLWARGAARRGGRS
jgi:hypothetical protein